MRTLKLGSKYCIVWSCSVLFPQTTSLVYITWSFLRKKVFFFTSSLPIWFHLLNHWQDITVKGKLYSTLLKVHISCSFQYVFIQVIFLEDIYHLPSTFSNNHSIFLCFIERISYKLMNQVLNSFYRISSWDLWFCRWLCIRAELHNTGILATQNVCSVHLWTFTYTSHVRCIVLDAVRDTKMNTLSSQSLRMSNEKGGQIHWHKKCKAGYKSQNKGIIPRAMVAERRDCCSYWQSWGKILGEVSFELCQRWEGFKKQKWAVSSCSLRNAHESKMKSARA